ncbi:MAG: SpoIIE family protein phosphatase [Selenomonadaceae bacterium]|nr:SpoIIE family protein phosphatase [Selenomonadaceae bacterium]
MKIGNMGIRKQVLYLVMSCSLITLFITGGIALYGMLNIKSDSIEVSSNIGEQASRNSSEILEAQKKSELIEIAADKAVDIRHRMNDFAHDVEMIAVQMHDIYLHPENFLPQSLDDSGQIQAGKINFYIQHSENFNSTQFANEIAMYTSIKDFLIRDAEFNSMIDSVFVASKNNFIISADDDRKKSPETFKPSPVIYDAVASDWYKLAVAENKMVFSKVRQFIFSKKLGVFCSVPFTDASGEILGVVGAQASLERINAIVQEADFGEDGFCFVVDDQNRIILSSKNNFEFGTESKFKFSGQGLIKDEIDGKNYFIAYAPVENMNWTFAAAFEQEKVNAPVAKNATIIENLTIENISKLNRHIFYTMISMAFGVLILLFAVTYIGRNLSDKLVRPLHILSDGVREISSGNLDKKIEVNTGNEIEHLAICFNAMTDELKTQMNDLKKITAEKERIATELNVAKDIQQSMLPRNFDFNRKDFEIYARMSAAKEVGGDFYDFYMLDEDHLVITIADVSGKGVPASLFMVVSKTVLKNFATFATKPDDFSAVISCANDQLCSGNDEMMFVTVFFGVLEISTGKFTYVNGGHNPPIIYHAKENRCEYLNVKKNFVLGGMDGMNFKQQEIYLDPGDLIFTYTDGVNEAMNINHEEYTSEKLLSFMNEVDCRQPLKDLLKSVRADVAKHVGEAEQSDDITMLAFRLNETKK